MRRIHLAVLFAAFWMLVHAEETLPGLTLARLFPGVTFSPQTPTLESVIGVRHGSRPLRHHELVRYLEALAKDSPRVRILEYGRTYEGRPLVVFAVSDENTVARLEEFRLEHARRTDPRSPEETRRGLEFAKAVAWMAYGIHGDELSSSDAAAALAYWLVAGEDENARAIRRELVVLIDPCENPDGRERFLAQTTSFAHATPNPDADDLSHTTVWPWGRGNHYLFDLNRDWFSLVHPESQRSSVIASWNAQLMVDSHEMGPSDTYLFSPARHPFNPFRPPYSQKWGTKFAAEQARALDRRGFAYYTREWNEEFFPGYGSAWASYHGAIGILYEMSSTEGTLVRQRAGTVRTFAEAVEHQLASSVANLETLRANRGEILREYVSERAEAIRRGKEGPVRAWLFAPGSDSERADSLAQLLRRQGIEVLRLSAPARASGLVDARTGKTSSVELPAGTWMVPLDQPAAPLARVLLDPHVPMDAEFLREEREYLEREKGSRLYDATAWSLLFAYGVDAYWTGSRPAGEWKTEPPVAPLGRVEGAPSVFGYVFDGTSDRAIFALGELLSKGIASRVAEKPFKVGGRNYPRGSILVKREGNGEDLASRLEEIARRWQIEMFATPSAKAEDGPDLGGNYFHPLVESRIGVLSGMPIAPQAYGFLWHLLDEQMRMRFTGIDVSQFGNLDLSRYNVLVFPPARGGAGGYQAVTGERGLERLRRWIEAGGTAIGIGNGAEFLADKQNKLTRARMRRQALDRYPPVVFGAAAGEAEAGGLLRAAGIRAVEPKSDETPDRSAENRKKEQEPVPLRDPYNVPPVLGPGARPFAPGDGGRELPSPMNLSAWLKPFLPPGKDRPDAEDLERADDRLRRFSPRGVFVRAELDRDLWLGWGIHEGIDVWLDASDTLVAEPPVQVAVRFSDLDSLHLGGLLWPEAAGRLAKTAYCTRESLGRGQVILFLDEPNYRGSLLGTRRLLLNALVLGPGLGSRWSSPW